MAFGGITGKATTNWTNEEILSAATAQSLGLSAGATPDEAFGALVSKSQSVQFASGYISSSNAVNLDFLPDIVLLSSESDNVSSISYYSDSVIMINNDQNKYITLYQNGNTFSIRVFWRNQQISCERYGQFIYYYAIKFS